MNQILVDSSVVLDLFTADPVFLDPAVSALSFWGADHDLCINDIIYSEVSVGFDRIEELEEALEGAGFKIIPIPREAYFLAGKAFLGYRRRGGVKTSPLPDFFIGAHAAVNCLPLLTRDPVRIRSSYPGVRILPVEA